ncbi:MAG: hypothetical protein M3310_06215, partial [Actinomycetota bacterium]|nr:hypothetical protein [Actinomycetota bacterium]
MARDAQDQDGRATNLGKIVEIRGVVIDAVFPNELPEIYTALRISVDGRDLVAEVQQ